jgi:hypothetical protein
MIRRVLGIRIVLMIGSLLVFVGATTAGAHTPTTGRMTVRVDDVQKRSTGASTRYFVMNEEARLVSVVHRYFTEVGFVSSFRTDLAPNDGILITVVEIREVPDGFRGYVDVAADGVIRVSKLSDSAPRSVIWAPLVAHD